MNSDEVIKKSKVKHVNKKEENKEEPSKPILSVDDPLLAALEEASKIQEEIKVSGRGGRKGGKKNKQ